MKLEKQKNFLITVSYWTVITAFAYLVIKYLVPQIYFMGTFGELCTDRRKRGACLRSRNGRSPSPGAFRK